MSRTDRWEADDDVIKALAQLVEFGPRERGNGPASATAFGMAIHAFGDAVAEAVDRSQLVAAHVFHPQVPVCPPHVVINGDRSCRLCEATRPGQPPCDCGTSSPATMPGRHDNPIYYHTIGCSLRQHLADWPQQ